MSPETLAELKALLAQAHQRAEELWVARQSAEESAALQRAQSQLQQANQEWHKAYQQEQALAKLIEEHTSKPEVSNA
jgi:hypothetical protein